MILQFCVHFTKICAVYRINSFRIKFKFVWIRKRYLPGGWCVLEKLCSSPTVRIRPVNNILTSPSGFLYSTLLRMAGSKITGRNLHFKKLDRYEHMINQSDSMI